MKKTLIALALLGTLLVSGCESSTAYGPCIGVSKDDANPKLVYKLSTMNVVLGAVFFQTLFAPIIVLVSETYCPVGTK